MYPKSFDLSLRKSNRLRQSQHFHKEIACQGDPLVPGGIAGILKGNSGELWKLGFAPWVDVKVKAQLFATFWIFLDPLKFFVASQNFWQNRFSAITILGGCQSKCCMWLYNFYLLCITPIKLRLGGETRIFIFKHVPLFCFLVNNSLRRPKMNKLHKYRMEAWRLYVYAILWSSEKKLV